MHTKEQKILRFSMILLFLALMIVYIVWYQVQGDQLKKILEPQNTGSSIQIVNKSGSIIPTINVGIDSQTGGITVTVPTTTGTTTGITIKNITGVSISSPKTNTGAITPNSTIKLLSGTSIYYGPIAIIEKLGIKYQYALTDEKGIWYIYLGTPSYDFASIARALKGSLYTLTTEQDLLQNKLFGNKVVFINLPEYKDKQVIMLFYLNDGIRLVQMEYNLYHKSKAYIKSLFID